MTGGPGGHDAVEERIQSYLDEVFVVARGRPREVRWLLAEVETHLRDSVDAGVAAGLDRWEAMEGALARFGPPAGVVRNASAPAYQTLAAQIGEAALLLVSVLGLAVGVASVPVAAIALVGGSDLVTGAQPGQPVSVDQLTEMVRNHLLAGVAGFIALTVWWVLYVRRRGRPIVLPAWFALTVCGVSSVGVAAVFLAVGVRDLARRTYLAAGGTVGAGDLIATGATVAVVAVLCWLTLGRQVTRPSRWMPERRSADLP